MNNKQKYHKFFTLHLEIGNESGIAGYYAKCTLGNNAVEFLYWSRDISLAVNDVIADMDQSCMWNPLKGDPSLCLHPIPQPVPSSILKVKPTKMLFELHIEVGDFNGKYYARTELLQCNATTSFDEYVMYNHDVYIIGGVCDKNPNIPDRSSTF